MSLAVLVAALVLGFAVVLAARTIRDGLVKLGSAVDGFWQSTTTPATYVPLDEVIAQHHLNNPFGGELVYDEEVETIEV